LLHTKELSKASINGKAGAIPIDKINGIIDNNMKYFASLEFAPIPT
jgi:hypothetical protein